MISHGGLGGILSLFYDNNKANTVYSIWQWGRWLCFQKQFIWRNPYEAGKCSIINCQISIVDFQCHLSRFKKGDINSKQSYYNLMHNGITTKTKKKQQQRQKTETEP